MVPAYTKQSFLLVIAQCICPDNCFISPFYQTRGRKEMEKTRFHTSMENWWERWRNSQPVTGKRLPWSWEVYCWICIRGYLWAERHDSQPSHCFYPTSVKIIYYIFSSKYASIYWNLMSSVLIFKGKSYLHIVLFSANFVMIVCISLNHLFPELTLHL